MSLLISFFFDPLPCLIVKRNSLVLTLITHPHCRFTPSPLQSFNKMNGVDFQRSLGRNVQCFGGFGLQSSPPPFPFFYEETPAQLLTGLMHGASPVYLPFIIMSLMRIPKVHPALNCCNTSHRLVEGKSCIHPHKTITQALSNEKKFGLIFTVCAFCLQH